jgi:formylglycine-generating enzyme required for sulfatase activity
MLNLRCAAVAVVVLLSMVAAVQGQDASSRRVALVIGNGAYPQSPIASAAADARAVADLLKDGGFDVTLVENAKRSEMEASISAFAGKLAWGVTAVVYFGGHAVQYRDRTFLLAIDSNIAGEADVRTKGVDVDLILDPLIVARPAGCVVILDAARRNPWQQVLSARLRGLANQPPLSGVSVIYPAAPGEVVSDAPRNAFVTELVKAARTPSLPFKEAFQRARTAIAQATRNQQIPWESSQSNLVIFDPSATPPPSTADPREAGFWNTVKGSENAADIKAYLDSYPNGSFAALARARLQQIEGRRPNVSALAAPTPPPQPQAPQSPLAQSPPAQSPPAQTQRALSLPAQAPVAQAPAPQSPSTIRDCALCPEMVLVPAGAFEMGSNEMFEFEKPVHRVSIRTDFYIGRHEVRFEEWDACVAEGGCAYKPDDRGLGRGKRPVTNVDWNDAKGYVAWLSQKSGFKYRLPTESEWEYAARAGSTTAYPWGPVVDKDRANCIGCNVEPLKRALDTGSFQPNAFGIHDMAGNAAEWVEDCWNDNYRGAPADGSAWTKPQCRERVLRGGSFNNDPRYLRSAARFRYDFDVRFYTNGLRVVRER